MNATLKLEYKHTIQPNAVQLCFHGTLDNGEVVAITRYTSSDVANRFTIGQHYDINTIVK